MRPCVVGLGQRAAGDDGVGHAVIGVLERRGLASAVQLQCLSDAMDLVPLFQDCSRLILVDAVLASPPGMVVQLSPEELSSRAPQPGSTHGFGVRQALEMARALTHAGTLPDVCVVAITIAPPDRYRFGLSPDVERALEDAADRIVELLEVPYHA